MTLDQAKKKIQTIADKSSHFKIGKTGQTLSERFDSEYRDTYDDYDEVCYSSEPKIIDQFEKDLIAHFKSDSKCDNVADGGGEMSESGTYRIYVVRTNIE